ncbi:MAG TPA: aldo/keto reductase [Polyangiales bacterium]|nr:aldo/keto reductase [Polyangiales bacterium]
MQNATLGQTGLRVSRLCLGTMTFGLQSDETTAQRILDTAADGGIDFLDTADVYPLGGDLSTAGRTEEVVGRWLKGKRSRFVVATKLSGKVGPKAWDQGNSRKHILDAIDNSLRRLQTDYVDLYQLHMDDPSTPLEETAQALDDVVRSGKVRYLGVSNFLAYRLGRLLGKQDARQLARIVSIQPRYSLLFREIERELLPLAREEGIGVIPYNPLAGGLLTGKHDLAKGPAEGTRFTLGTAADRYQDRYWHDREFQTVRALQQLVEGRPLTTVALAWVLANPVISSAIIGASKPEQLKDTLAAVDYKLEPALKQKLDELTAEYRRGAAER